MKIARKLMGLLALAIMQATTTLALAENLAIAQDHALLRQAAADFLKLQSAGHPGQSNINVGPIDSRLNLPACANLAPFLPPGNKPWGKITLGIRCSAPSSWVIYLQANVQVFSEYYVAAAPLVQGQILCAADLSKVKGDLSSLPAGTVTNAEQAIGKTMLSSIPAGSVLRMDALKNPPVVQQGQSVRVISSGPGFQVATDAQALSNASDGQIARAKTVSGQTVSGIARAGGIIEITY